VQASDSQVAPDGWQQEFDGALLLNRDRYRAERPALQPYRRPFSRRPPVVGIGAGVGDQIPGNFGRGPPGGQGINQFSVAQHAHHACLCGWKNCNGINRCVEKAVLFPLHVRRAYQHRHSGLNSFRLKRRDVSDDLEFPDLRTGSLQAQDRRAHLHAIAFVHLQFENATGIGGNDPAVDV